jgi:hypothetical protein
VVFGPGSVIYGSDAIGGVMSFQVRGLAQGHAKAEIFLPLGITIPIFDTQIPFGQYLAIAGWIQFIAGVDFLGLYLAWAAGS